MAPSLFDGPGADIPAPLLSEARAFLEAGGHAGGGGLRRSARVLIARDGPQGAVVAVAAGQRLTAVDRQRPVSCLVVQQLRLGPGWAGHGPLLRCLAAALLGSLRGTLVLWAAPTASAHAAATRCLPALLPRFGERLPGDRAAIRDRVMSRVDPNGWDPLRGGVHLRSPAGVPITRHVCVLRATPLAWLRLAVQAARVVLTPTGRHAPNVAT